jgi:chromosome segregation ATPase
MILKQKYEELEELAHEGK